MHTVITSPGDGAHEAKMLIIETHTAGSHVIEERTAFNGSRLVLAKTRAGHYLVYVHNHGHCRLSALNDEAEARRLFQLICEAHDIRQGID